MQMQYGGMGGMGMVPQAVSLTQTSDPQLKCCVEECNNVGTSTCVYYLRACCASKQGGCQRPYCAQHQFLDTTRSMAITHNKSCVFCGPEKQEKEFQAAKFVAKCGVITLATLIMLGSLVPILLAITA